MSTAFDRIGNDRELQDHWIRRIIAVIIDSLIIYVIAWIIASVLAILALPTLLAGGIFMFLGPFEFLRGVIFFLYAAFLESTMGATFGKQLMNLKVTTTQGYSAGFDKTVIRNVSKIHGLLTLIDTLIGMATVGDPHQKLSDRYAGTTVASTISWGMIIPASPSPSVPTPPSPPQA